MTMRERRILREYGLPPPLRAEAAYQRNRLASGSSDSKRMRIRLSDTHPFVFKASTILTVRRLRRSARQMFCAVFCACALCHQSLLSMIHTPPRRTEMSAQLPLISLETAKCSLLYFPDIRYQTYLPSDGEISKTYSIFYSKCPLMRILPLRLSTLITKTSYRSTQIFILADLL